MKLLDRYASWALRRKHYMLWSFWVPFAGMFMLAYIVVYLVMA
jgi:hypothetical protein